MILSTDFYGNIQHTDTDRDREIFRSYLKKIESIPPTVDRDHPRASFLRDVYYDLHIIIDELEGLEVHGEERGGREMLVEFYQSIVTNIFEFLESIGENLREPVYTDHSLPSQRRRFCKMMDALLTI
jgi:hypothetical protein